MPKSNSSATESSESSSSNIVLSGSERASSDSEKKLSHASQKANSQSPKEKSSSQKAVSPVPAPKAKSPSPPRAQTSSSPASVVSATTSTSAQLSVLSKASSARQSVVGQKPSAPKPSAPNPQVKKPSPSSSSSSSQDEKKIPEKKSAEVREGPCHGGPGGMTAAEIKNLLAKRKIPFSPYANKAKLCGMLSNAPAAAAPKADVRAIWEIKRLAPDNLIVGVGSGYSAQALKDYLRRHNIILPAHHSKATLIQLMVDNDLVAMDALPARTQAALKNRHVEAKQAQRLIKGSEDSVVAKINAEIAQESQEKVCGKGNGRDLRPRAQLERWLRSLKIPFRINDTKDVLCGKLAKAGVNV